MGTLFVDKLDPQSGTSLEIGSSGDTITIPSGATLSNSGIMTGQNYPAFQAYLGSTQNVTSGTTTKVNINTEVFDTDSMYDASTNYRFTPTTAGKYFCFLNLESSWSSAYGDNMEVEIQKNGSSALRTRFILQTGSGNGFYGVLNTCGILEFNGSSDYIEAYAKYDGDGPFFVSGTNKTFFGAYRIGT